jgi:hypothetical protein
VSQKTAAKLASQVTARMASTCKASCVCFGSHLTMKYATKGSCPTIRICQVWGGRALVRFMDNPIDQRVTHDQGQRSKRHPKR